MHFNVTYIDFDFDDEHISKDERVEITQDHIGKWEAVDDDDLIDEISTSSGWLIRKIDYDIQLS